MGSRPQTYSRQPVHGVDHEHVTLAEILESSLELWPVSILAARLVGEALVYTYTVELALRVLVCSKKEVSLTATCSATGTMHANALSLSKFRAPFFLQRGPWMLAR